MWSGEHTTNTDLPKWSTTQLVDLSLLLAAMTVRNHEWNQKAVLTQVIMRIKQPDGKMISQPRRTLGFILSAMVAMLSWEHDVKSLGTHLQKPTAGEGTLALHLQAIAFRIELGWRR